MTPVEGTRKDFRCRQNFCGLAPPPWPCSPAARPLLSRLRLLPRERRRSTATATTAARAGEGRPRPGAARMDQGLRRRSAIAEGSLLHDARLRPAGRPADLWRSRFTIPRARPKVIRLLLPPGLLLKPGFRFSIDKGPQETGAFEICFPNGCFAEAKVKPATVDSMKKAEKMAVVVKIRSRTK